MNIPRFILCAWICLAPAAQPAAVAADGDEHWSYEFGWPGTLETINAIREHDGKLYFGGGTPGAGTNASLFVFDGKQLTRLALFTGASGTYIYDLHFVGSSLYVGGYFTNVEGVAVRGMAGWDGHSWSATGLTNGTVVTLASDGPDLFVGGVFTNPGGVALTNVGRWDGVAWHAMGSGLGGTNTIPFDVVRSLVVTNGILYAGGNFSNAGTVALRNIAMWDGLTWSPVGGGIQGTTVYGLTWNSSSLYAAGIFNQAGTTPANNVARWDGISWSALGSGVANIAVSVTGFSNLIYVAGNFTSAGGNAITNVAVWDGSSWSSAGATPSAPVSRAYSTGTRLYIGGNFLTAAGAVMAGLAQWDGLRWSPVGPANRMAGLQNIARAITSDGSSLYAGGAFTYAGQTNAAHIGRYDGRKWHPVGAGLNADVRQLALSGTNLYAAGDFSGGAGGPLALRLARWDGALWQPLNNTAFNNISSLAARGSDLLDRKSTRLNSSHGKLSRMPSSA